jgi:hypothetical protein
MKNGQLNVDSSSNCKGWRVVNSRNPARINERFDEVLGAGRSALTPQPKALNRLRVNFVACIRRASFANREMRTET